MKKRPRMSFPKPLSDLYLDALSGSGLADRLRETEIWRIWSEIVGPAIATQAQPLRIINGTLTVAVSSGPWMQELTFLKGMMKEKLNSRIGSDVVKEIVLKSGRIAKKVQEVPEKEPAKKVLTGRQLALIAEQAAAIPDEETRKCFEELMRASFECSR